MTAPPTTPAAEKLLARLRKVPPEELPERVWEVVPPADRPLLFRLLATAADLPRLASSRALARPATLAAWPGLARPLRDVALLQGVVDRPTAPPDALPASVRAAVAPDEAREELERTHCVTVEGLLDRAERERLEERIGVLRQSGRDGDWGQLDAAEEPELHRIFGGMLASEAFRAITDWTAGRDDFTLTLSLQSLDATGIGWHRDLYWPREWVGEDVFSVLYALGSDRPEKGGAFVYWVPWTREVRSLYRQAHQATILWNARDDGGRLLHAVTGYAGDDTERLLVILQCRRRMEAPA